MEFRQHLIAIGTTRNSEDLKQMYDKVANGYDEVSDTESF